MKRLPEATKCMIDAPIGPIDAYRPFLANLWVKLHVPIEGSTPWRKGPRMCGDQPVSAGAPAFPHRQRWTHAPHAIGCPLATMSDSCPWASGWRGGPSEEQDASHLPGIPPVGPLEGDPDSRDWCGHAWSAWIAVQEAFRIIPPDANGLYRLRVPGQAEWLSIGQGLVRDRLLAHLLKGGQPTHRQSALFTGPLECSWVLDSSWFPHQRLELENDVIAASVLSTGTIPQAQFIG